MTLMPMPMYCTPFSMAPVYSHSSHTFKSHTLRVCIRHIVLRSSAVFLQSCLYRTANMSETTTGRGLLQMPSFVLYEGVDPSLEHTYACFTCGERPATKNGALMNSLLQQCSRCRLAHYCSSECQRQDFHHHKDHCKTIKKLQIDLEKLAGALGSGVSLFGKKHDCVPRCFSLW